MKYALLFLILFTHLALAKDPCDLHVGGSLSKTEDDLLNKLDALAERKPTLNQLNEISDGIQNYLLTKGLGFEVKTVTIKKSDFGFIPDSFDGPEFQARVLEIDSAHPFSQSVNQKYPGTKLYYSPELEMMRPESPNRILKFQDGLILSVKDLYYFERPAVFHRIEKTFIEPLANFEKIPATKDKALFSQYIAHVKTHLKNTNVQFTEEGEGAELLFRITPAMDGTRLNRLAASIHEKFNEAGLVFHPYAIQEKGAAGMFKSTTNTVYISHQSVLESSIDYVIVHELMHAHINNNLFKQFKYSPFHGKVHAKVGLEFSGMDYYKGYFSFEEVATHSLDVHMSAKKMFYQMEGKNVGRDDFTNLLINTRVARQIASKAVEVTEAALNQINRIETFSIDSLDWLLGAEGKGFTLKVSTSELNADIPLFFRNESDEIRDIAAKYAKDEVVSKSDLKKLKNYLKAVLEERKNLFQQVARDHKELLDFLKSKQSERKFTSFNEDQMQSLLSLSLKGRSSCLSHDFENIPEVKKSLSFFEKYLRW